MQDTVSREPDPNQLRRQASTQHCHARDYLVSRWAGLGRVRWLVDCDYGLSCRAERANPDSERSPRSWRTSLRGLTMAASSASIGTITGSQPTRVVAATRYGEYRTVGRPRQRRRTVPAGPRPRRARLAAARCASSRGARAPELPHTASQHRRTPNAVRVRAAWPPT